MERRGRCPHLSPAQDPFVHSPLALISESVGITKALSTRLHHNTMAILPDGAACYFCLGEDEGAEEGLSLVRDCSCRGDSAGFAHLNCLVTYAEQKCRAANYIDMEAFTEPWHKCNNCKQPFQNQLAIDLASAFISFTEATYGHPGNSKWDKLKVMAALRIKIMSLSNNAHDAIMNMDTTEAIMIINKLLSMVDHTKEDLKMSGWIHMPKHSGEYQYYTMLCGDFEAFSHGQLGRLTLKCIGSQDDYKISIKHFKKARAIYNLVGMTDQANVMEFKIKTETSFMLAFTEENLKDENLKDKNLSSTVKSLIFQTWKDDYEKNLNNNGIESRFTIRSGLEYAKLLRREACFIEALRLVTKLAHVSRRVLGPEHKMTKEYDDLLKSFEVREVIVLPDIRHFQALRYENEGEICVVQGPITKPREVDEERIYRVESYLTLPFIGCPVICHGLLSASHLNGELGEVRKMKGTEDGIRLAVYFEKKGVKSALVKPGNVQVAFELPSSSEE